MILTGRRIKSEVEGNRIVISPFKNSNINTNSYDLTLGDQFIRYKSSILDPKIANTFEELITDNTKGLLLKKGDFILGSSQEIVGSNHYVPIIHAKSGIARLGLFVHVTADLIDIGSIGNVTFQLYSTHDCWIYPGQKIAQVTFWKPEGKITLYQGKYQNSRGPKASKIYKDFTN